MPYIVINKAVCVFCHNLSLECLLKSINKVMPYIVINKAVRVFCHNLKIKSV